MCGLFFFFFTSCSSVKLRLDSYDNFRECCSQTKVHIAISCTDLGLPPLTSPCVSKPSRNPSTSFLTTGGLRKASSLGSHFHVPIASCKYTCSFSAHDFVSRLEIVETCKLNISRLGLVLLCRPFDPYVFSEPVAFCMVNYSDDCITSAFLDKNGGRKLSSTTKVPTPLRKARPVHFRGYTSRHSPV